MFSFFRRYQAGLHWLPALFFAIFIFIASATPGNEIDQSSYEVRAAIQAITRTVTLTIHDTSATHVTSAVHAASVVPAIPAAHATSAVHAAATTYAASAVHAASSAPAIPATHAASSIALIPPDMDWLKVGHVIVYFCLGFSVLYALSARSRWSPSLALIICTVYAFTDEFHQVFTPGRDPSPRDILLDMLAALMGVAVMLGVMASKEFFKQE